MDIAADAVADIFAPRSPAPVRARNAGPGDAPEPTFDDLVAAESVEHPARVGAKAHAGEKEHAEEPAAHDEPEPAETAASQPATAPPSTQTLLDVIAKLQANHPAPPPSEPAASTQPDAAQSNEGEQAASPDVPHCMSSAAADHLPQAAISPLMAAGQDATDPPASRATPAPTAIAIEKLTALVAGRQDSELPVTPSAQVSADGQASSAPQGSMQSAPNSDQPALQANQPAQQSGRPVQPTDQPVQQTSQPASQSDQPAPQLLATIATAPTPVKANSAPAEPRSGDVDAALVPASNHAAPELPIDKPGSPRASGDDFRLALQAVNARQDGAQPPGRSVGERLEAPPPTPELTAPAPSQPGLVQIAEAPAAPINFSHARIAVPAVQIAQEIIRRFDGDTTSFELRLDPPELGRVEIRLDVSRDHRVTATVAADNPQALADLTRHARELEQALQSAGLTLSDNGLSFDLRQGGEGNRADRGPDKPNIGDAMNGDAEAVDAQPVAARPVGYERWRGVRLDITV